MLKIVKIFAILIFLPYICIKKMMVVLITLMSILCSLLMVIVNIVLFTENLADVASIYYSAALCLAYFVMINAFIYGIAHIIIKMISFIYNKKNK